MAGDGGCPGRAAARVDVRRIGRRAAGRIPVLTGLAPPSRDEFVGFCAAFAIVCAEAMVHIYNGGGVTASG